MKILAWCIALAVIPAFRGNADGADPTPVALFNGTNLDGWVQMNGGSFTATNGVIHIEGGQGWLRTGKEHGDFILTAEWRGMKTNYNSGVFIRAPIAGQPWAPDIWQINTKQTGIGELLAGSAKIIRSTTRPVSPGEWVKFRIEARGTNLTLGVNEQRVWEFHALKPATGYIGLQAEGKPFEFRNLQILDLTADSP
ncbi:MAG TPA: DUF1080 domain-containing protein [Candidatus Acidoferrum sp.]|nr:DUF1080 domain-containing protein [Candidatus Acidoferrum sp.]